MLAAIIRDNCAYKQQMRHVLYNGFRYIVYSADLLPK